MTISDFQNSETPKAEWNSALIALWQDAHGAWQKAHEYVQQEESGDATWVHAYLHRKEGDISNAQYWYSRAGRAMFSGSLADEWTAIATSLLERQPGK